MTRDCTNCDRMATDIHSYDAKYSTCGGNLMQILNITLSGCNLNCQHCEFPTARECPDGLGQGEKFDSMRNTIRQAKILSLEISDIYVVGAEPFCKCNANIMEKVFSMDECEESVAINISTNAITRGSYFDGVSADAIEARLISLFSGFKPVRIIIHMTEDLLREVEDNKAHLYTAILNLCHHFNKTLTLGFIHVAPYGWESEDVCVTTMVIKQRNA